MNRDETRQWLIDRNREYRIGKPTVSDPYFDNIYKDFCDKYPDDILAQKNILEEIPIDDADKVKLPIPMFSLNKIKTMQALYNWAETKKIPNDAELILTSKYDSISLCVSEEYSLAYTRGDGEYGLPRNEHLRDIQAYSIMNCSNVNKHNMYTYGEAIIPKQIWIDKFENKINPYNNKLFKNGRNTVAGLFNNKTNITELLNDVVYMRYGLVDDESENLKKSQILDKLNTLNVIEVPYLIVKLNDPELETIINNQFEIWKEYFEIDGIVIELNDPELRKKLGREDNNNPAWARAFKNPAWAQVEQTTVNKLEINISKQGILNPVLIIDPVYIGGAEIKRATGYNMKYMLENNICVGPQVLLPQ
jgi:DNA ligase (NAD+)